MLEKIESLKSAVEALNASTKEEVEALRIKYLSKKGEISALFNDFRNVPNEQKKEIGQKLNQLKVLATDKINALRENIETSDDADAAIDLTRPSAVSPLGTRHPISLIRNEIISIFSRLGFTVADGPEVEDDWHVFSALNFAADHPARDMQDTYYLSNGQLLKTHTSAAQNTILRKYAADLEKGIPLRAVFPGRCFRNEKIDACHENTFFQMEGMMVDKDISISNLIYFMKTMLSEVFQKDVTVRLRPGFFPFVEPGFELDIQCLICGGEGCSSCKDSGWLELCPCGMIHPNVLKAGGIDPEKYSGFAFGLGLTRLAMMKYGVKDIRVFNSCNLKSLSQFTNSSFTVPDDTKKEEA